MRGILNFVILIIVAYFICAPKIKVIREFKRNREEGKLSRQVNKNAAKTVYFMLGSSVIIPIIFNIIYENYVKRVNISISVFFFEVISVLACECIIGSLWAFAREVILTYKKEGFLIGTFTLIVTIIIIVGMMYVKYKNLLSK